MRFSPIARFQLSRALVVVEAIAVVVLILLVAHAEVKLEVPVDVDGDEAWDLRGHLLRRVSIGHGTAGTSSVFVSIIQGL